MQFVSLISLIIVLCAFCLSDACNGRNANALIDEILSNAKPDLAKRIILPDINDGDQKLWDISVWGFDSLKRGGNVCFENNGKTRQTVRANFEVFNIRGFTRGSYTVKVKVFGIKIAQETFKGTVDATIPHVKIRFVIDINHNERRITLKEFAFEKFDNAKFKINLSGIWKTLNSVMSKISPIWKIFNLLGSKLVDRMGNKQLKPKAETMIRDSFTKALAKFNKFDLIPR